MNVRWLDGKDAKDQYILEVRHKNGSVGFLKNYSLEKLCEYRDIFQKYEDWAGFIIHAPNSLTMKIAA